MNYNITWSLECFLSIAIVSDDLSIVRRVSNFTSLPSLLIISFELDVPTKIKVKSIVKIINA